MFVCRHLPVPVPRWPSLASGPRRRAAPSRRRCSGRTRGSCRCASPPRTTRIYKQNRSDLKPRARQQLNPGVQLWLLPPADEVWGKVIFSQASISHSVWGVGGWSATGSRWYAHPSWTHPPGFTHTPYGQQAGGTHPTGMLYCYYFWYNATSETLLRCLF